MSASPAKVGGSPAAPALRRCACGGGCPSCAAKKEEEEEEELHREDGGGGGAPGYAPPVVHEVLASPGRALPGPTRSFMESRFGADFGAVRVHDDARAAESARAVDAHAYTVGSHVAFAARRYAPGTPAGDRLLAHELAHTLQQGGMARRLQRHSCREGEGPPTAEPADAGEAGAHPLVYRGVTPHRSRRPSVGDAQELLNRFLERLDNGDAPCGASADLDEIARLRATLNQDPLEVDCRFGPNTETVTTMFQRCVFPGQPIEWDGKIGSKTWAQLETLRPAPSVPTTPPTPSEPPGPISCPVVSAVPGTPVPASVGRRGACGGGPDFRFLDFPTLTLAESIAAAPFRALPDMGLRGILSQELGLLGRGIGVGMLRQFFAATGTPLSHAPGSPLSTEVAASPTFAAAEAAAETEVQAQVLAMAGACHIDWRTLSLLPVPGLPGLNFNILAGDTLQLNAVLGGTQGLEVFIRDFLVPPGGRTYTAVLRFEICDDFGVDDTDLDPTTGHGSPGLFAFWVLQHERAGQQPFVNFVEVDVPISGTF